MTGCSRGKWCEWSSLVMEDERRRLVKILAEFL